MIYNVIRCVFGSIQPFRAALWLFSVAMGNLAGAQCPPWGTDVAMQDAYEAMEADHDIELTPAYEYHKLEPENADQEPLNRLFERPFSSPIATSS